MDDMIRYATIFDRVSFGGEVAVDDVMSYFAACNLYPTAVEVKRALRKVHTTRFV